LAAGKTAMTDERYAEFGLHGWHGITWSPCVVIGETPKRYRVRLMQACRLAGRMNFGAAGDIVLLPKSAVRFTATKPEHRSNRSGHVDYEMQWRKS
jgi:hypothetical protein